jgi:predicted DNA-binding protein
MAKQKSPLSLRLDPETDERLELAAERTKIKKHALAQMAVEAVIDAIEQNDFCLVVPIKFQVKKVPTNAPTVYPTRGEQMIVEERGIESYKLKKGKK